MDERPKKPTMPESDAMTLAIKAARIARDDNCEDIIVLDLRGISPVTDFFVIATGTSDRQIRATCDSIAQHGKNTGQKVWKIAGEDKGDWIVMDFVDIVVHLFDSEHRDYYDLEMIWGEVPRIAWEDQGRHEHS
jgi:ribosome-associated protein